MADLVEVPDNPVTTQVTFVFPMDKICDIELSLPVVPQRGQPVVVWDVGTFVVQNLTWVLEPGLCGDWIVRARIDLERVLS